MTNALGGLARRLPIVFPLHPRTEGRLLEAGLDPERLGEKGIRLCLPLGYLDFLALEAEAAVVLTDSGGVQEETSVLGVRCFTLRDTTERPITVECGTNTVLGVDPAQVRRIPHMLNERKIGPFGRFHCGTVEPASRGDGNRGVSSPSRAPIRTYVPLRQRGRPWQQKVTPSSSDARPLLDHEVGRPAGEMTSSYAMTPTYAIVGLIELRALLRSERGVPRSRAATRGRLSKRT
jgi:hypothetical protein